MTSKGSKEMFCIFPLWTFNSINKKKKKILFVHQDMLWPLEGISDPVYRALWSCLSFKCHAPETAQAGSSMSQTLKFCSNYK